MYHCLVLWKEIPGHDGQLVPVQVLAHHPDWPSPEELEEDPQLLQPFASILHFALHALLLPDGASPQAIGASPVPQISTWNFRYVDCRCALSHDNRSYRKNALP